MLCSRATCLNQQAFRTATPLLYLRHHDHCIPKPHYVAVSPYSRASSAFPRPCAFKLSNSKETHMPNLTSQCGSKPKPRRVVTSLVQRSDGTILLVKRSSKANSYRSMWAGVSNSLSPGEDLLVRARADLHAELGLAPEQLQFTCSGRPLLVEDNGRHYLVHPLLFRLVDERAVLTLSWENSEYHWVQPSGVHALPHVPLLPETLSRVLLPPTMAAHVVQVCSVRASGAAALEAAVMDTFVELSREECGLDPPPGQLQEVVVEQYRDFAYHLVCSQPSSPVVANTTTAVMLALEDDLRRRADPFEPDHCKVHACMYESLCEVMRGRARALERSVQCLLGLLQQSRCVAVLSASSAVIEALAQHASTGETGVEYTALASSDTLAAIRSAAVPVAPLVCPAPGAGAGVGPDPDVLLLTVSAVTPQGVVVSQQVADAVHTLLASHPDHPHVYAVIDSLSLAPTTIPALAFPDTTLPAPAYAAPGGPTAAAGQDDSSAWPGSAGPAGGEARTLPWSALAGFITEQGVLDSTQVQALLAERTAEYVEAFLIPSMA